MSIFNINPMPDDEENQTIPPTATSDNDFQDIISNDQPATTVTPTTPTPAATPAPKQKPALSEFEQYKQMYPDDAIQKYVESFKPNPNDDRSARFAKYAKLNAIGQGLAAIANMVGASHGAKIYAPQQNNTTQQLIGASEQEKAKQEEKQKQYNLMKYQSALNTLNGYRTYKAAAAKQAWETDEKGKDRDNAKTIAEGNNATSEKVAGLNITAAEARAKDQQTFSANEAAKGRSFTAGQNQNNQQFTLTKEQQTEQNKLNHYTQGMIDGKTVTVSKGAYNDLMSPKYLTKEQQATIDNLSITNPAAAVGYKNSLFNDLLNKYYTVDKNGTLVPKQTPTSAKISFKPDTYKIVTGSAAGKTYTRNELLKMGYGSEQFNQALQLGNIQRIN